MTIIIAKLKTEFHLRCVRFEPCLMNKKQIGLLGAFLAIALTAVFLLVAVNRSASSVTEFRAVNPQDGPPVYPDTLQTDASTPAQSQPNSLEQPASSTQPVTVKKPILPPSTEAVNNKRSRPNLVLIYSDDIDCESLRFDWNRLDQDPNYQVGFPTLKKMADEGLSFSNFHVTTPVCGPSRACLFSAQYAHRNNFRVNDPANPFSCGFTGGFDVFDRQNEMGHWMQSAGYSTAFVGKYLHCLLYTSPSPRD